MQVNKETAEAPDSGPYLFDTHELKRRVPLSARKLWALTNQGAIPCRRIGRRVLYSPKEVQAWIDAGCPETNFTRG